MGFLFFKPFPYKMKRLIYFLVLLLICPGQQVFGQSFGMDDVDIVDEKIVFKLDNGGERESEFETQGQLQDENGRLYKGNEIRDNLDLDRFDDVREGIETTLLEMFKESGYTPSKLLLDFKDGGCRFDLQIFQSPDGEASHVICELCFRTKLYIKPFTRML